MSSGEEWCVESGDVEAIRASIREPERFEERSWRAMLDLLDEVFG